MVVIAKADAPPPEGSTAVKVWLVFIRAFRGSHTIECGTLFIKSCTSSLLKAFSDPSALIPRVSRNLPKCNANTAVGWRRMPKDEV